MEQLRIKSPDLQQSCPLAAAFDDWAVYELASKHTMATNGPAVWVLPSARRDSAGPDTPEAFYCK